MSEALSQDQEKALSLHNDKRREKDLEPLTWDDDLANQATQYAQYLADIGELQHSSGDQRPDQGENLAA
jgi:uncharacterized protein YkwD